MIPHMFSNTPNEDVQGLTAILIYILPQAKKSLIRKCLKAAVIEHWSCSTIVFP